MQGSVQIKPGRLKAAKAAYNASINNTNPGLIDGNGRSHAGNPFNVSGDGSVSFNRWTDAENRRSAQDTFATGSDGERRPAWQTVPEYYNDEARDQFDYISAALKELQGDGYGRMSSLYNEALGNLD